MFVTRMDGSSAPQSADSHGIVDVVGGGLNNLRAVSTDGLLAGMTTQPDPDPAAPACSAVYDEQAGKALAGRQVTLPTTKPNARGARMKRPVTLPISEVRSLAGAEGRKGRLSKAQVAQATEAYEAAQG